MISRSIFSLLTAAKTRRSVQNVGVGIIEEEIENVERGGREMRQAGLNGDGRDSWCVVRHAGADEGECGAPPIA